MSDCPISDCPMAMDSPEMIGLNNAVRAVNNADDHYREGQTYHQCMARAMLSLCLKSMDEFIHKNICSGTCMARDLRKVASAALKNEP